jgi:hypothetical protein
MDHVSPTTISRTRLVPLSLELAITSFTEKSNSKMRRMELQDISTSEESGRGQGTTLKGILRRMVSKSAKRYSETIWGMLTLTMRDFSI